MVLNSDSVVISIDSLDWFSISEMRLSAIPELVFMPSAAETLLIGFLDETVVAFRPGTDYPCAYFGFLVELVVAFIVCHALPSFRNEFFV